jgi:uncharacterized membrane protein YoaK (UPF0700 family)
VPATDDADGRDGRRTEDGPRGEAGPRGAAGQRGADGGRSGQRDAAAITILAVVLTVGTGATDVASLTRLGNVFTSVMTGNLVLLGLAVGRLSGALATHAVLAFAGYLAGVAAGARLVPAGQAPGAPWHHTLPAALLVELVLLAGFTVGWELTGGAPRSAAQAVLLAVAAAAMGTQSAAARGFGARVSTTYLTGTLTSVVAAWVTPGRPARMQWREVSLLAALAAGAAAGGLMIANAPAALPAIPLTTVVLVIGTAWAVGGGSPWSAFRSLWPGRTR